MMEMTKMTGLEEKHVKTAIINMFHMFKYVKKNMKIPIREIGILKKNQTCRNLKI